MNEIAHSTPAGRNWVVNQQRIGERFAVHHGVSIRFKSDPMETITARLYRDGNLAGLCSIRGRSEPFEQFARWGSLLVTFANIQFLMAAAERERTTAFFVAGFGDGMTAWWNLDGMERALKPRARSTRATCNGGIAQRVNAHLPMDEAAIISPLDFV